MVVAVATAVTVAIVVTVTDTVVMVATAEGMFTSRDVGSLVCRKRRPLPASEHILSHQTLQANSWFSRSNGYSNGGGGGYGGGGYGGGGGFGGGGGDRMSALGAGLQKQDWGKSLSSCKPRFASH